TILVTVSVAGIGIIKKLNSAEDWVDHTYEVINLTHLVSDKLQNVEINQSLYYLAESRQNVVTVKNEFAALDNDVRKLKLLTADNPSQTRRIDMLGSCLLKQLNNYSGAIFSRDVSKAAGVSRLQETIMASRNCKAILNNIINAEKVLLTQRKQLSGRNSGLAFFIILFSSVLDIALLAGLYVFIKRSFEEKQVITDKLKLSEAKFSTAFNDSAAGMAIVSLDGEWLEVNSYLEHLLGYTKEEFYQTNAIALTHPNDVPLNLELIKQVENGEITQFQIEKRYVHKNGTPIWVLVNVSAIHHQAGIKPLAVTQVIDISGLKELMGKMELKNAELSHTASQLTDKITQLEDFNNIVAHNLRGHAKTIEYILQMIAEEESEEEKNQYMAMLSEISNSLNSTLDELLKVLEIKLNHDISVDSCALQDVTDNITLLLKGEILKAKAVVTTEFAVKQINFPKVYLDSIFYNLVSNSLKYRRDNVPVEIKISSKKNGESTILVFEDNGIGIDLVRHGKDVFKLNKVFHSGFDSRGVGLFITKNQIEAHGGTIRVESQPGNGTKFTIALAQGHLHLMEEQLSESL
ncbi:MAG: PAS domain S-box protein, partial [Bacteroidota bacterium]|nr:PAS domain S-box protein [Bacteroidota bacterium]